MRECSACKISCFVQDVVSNLEMLSVLKPIHCGP
jgi:hypothetical protein